MLAVKAVLQNYVPTSEMLRLLEEFRKMVNDCIRIGLAEGVTSKQSLCKKVYHQLSRYDVPTYYRLTAVSKAVGIIRNYIRTLKKHPDAKKPYASKLMLVDCYAFRIVDGKLRLPIKPRSYEYIALNLHVLRSISGYTVRSVTLTASTVNISFSKETAVTEPTGLVGIDRNVNVVATATDKGDVTRYDLSETSRIKATYRMVKSHFKRDDARIRKRIFGKYGRKQRNRVNQRLHLVSKAIVEQAKEKRLGIIMENLKGIRKLYRKGNGQGTNYRSRLNSWSFYELQRQVEYKAKWEGIPIIYVPPQKTSSVCATCDSQIVECTEGKVYCPHCKRTMDRDENAALNIVKRGLRFKPIGLACEAMKGNENPSNEATPILRADASKLTRHPTVNTCRQHPQS
jgi:putative transposase